MVVRAVAAQIKYEMKICRNLLHLIRMAIRQTSHVGVAKVTISLGNANGIRDKKSSTSCSSYPRIRFRGIGGFIRQLIDF